MSDNHTPKNIRLQNLLAEHADKLAAGQFIDQRALLKKYGLTEDSWAVQVLNLAETLSDTFPQVNPSEKFVSDLYHELVGLEEITLVDRLLMPQLERLRQLPRHMQWAAGLGGLTITAGFVWIATRGNRNSDDNLSSPDSLTTTATA